MNLAIDCDAYIGTGLVLSCRLLYGRVYVDAFIPEVSDTGPPGVAGGACVQEIYEILSEGPFIYGLCHHETVAEALPDMLTNLHEGFEQQTLDTVC